MRTEERRRVMATWPDGRTEFFETAKEAAKAVGKNRNTILNRIHDGKPDKEGRVWDRELTDEDWKQELKEAV